MEMENVILSICLVTYCHEDYIREALDSILMQRMNFKYEILVGEDASLDKTKAILKEYEKKHPDTFTMYYREKNMHHTSISNAMDLRSRCKGKYVIMLEGDDYWIDSNKLQEQVDFLENNPDYIAVAHNCKVVDKNSNEISYKYPECKDEEYSLEHFVSEIMPGQLTTVMYRREDVHCYPIMQQRLFVGDRVLFFVIATQGKVKCIQEKKSAYRRVTDEGTSFSSNYRYCYDDAKRYALELIKHADFVGNKKAKDFAEIILLKHMGGGLKTKQLTLQIFIKEVYQYKFNMRVLVLFVRQLINHKILKKRLWL